MEAEDLVKQLSEPFTPDDAFMFGPHSELDLDDIQAIANSKETLSCDGVCSFKFLVHYFDDKDECTLCCQILES